MSDMRKTSRQFGLFVPVLLALIGLALWFGFQNVQLLRERSNLKTLRAKQEGIYNNARKMRAQLDALAGGTARLARAGNPHAAEIVKALQARGVTLDPGDAEKPLKQ